VAPLTTITSGLPSRYSRAAWLRMDMSVGRMAALPLLKWITSAAGVFWESCSFAGVAGATADFVIVLGDGAAAGGAVPAGAWAQAVPAAMRKPAVAIILSRMIVSFLLVVASGKDHSDRAGCGHRFTSGKLRGSVPAQQRLQPMGDIERPRPVLGEEVIDALRPFTTVLSAIAWLADKNG
jgi:hypothetical protein